MSHHDWLTKYVGEFLKEKKCGELEDIWDASPRLGLVQPSTVSLIATPIYDSDPILVINVTFLFELPEYSNIHLSMQEKEFKSMQGGQTLI